MLHGPTGPALGRAGRVRRPSVHTLLDGAVSRVGIFPPYIRREQHFSCSWPSARAACQSDLVRPRRCADPAGPSPPIRRKIRRFAPSMRPVASAPSTTLLLSRVVKKTRLFRIFGGLHYSLNLKRFMFVLGMVRTPEGESSLVTSSKLYTFFSFISILKGTERVFVYVLLYKAFIKT